MSNDDFRFQTFDSDEFGDEPDDSTRSYRTPSDPDEAWTYRTYSASERAYGDDDTVDEYDDVADEIEVVDDGDDEFVPVNVEPDRDLSQQIRRERPAARRRRTPTPPTNQSRVWLSTLRTLVVIILAALMISTIFSLWTRPTFLPDEFRAGLNRVQATQHLINIQPSPIPTNVQEVQIGIIAGHSGPPRDESFETDPGAVCPDGLTELEINLAVARQAVMILSMDGYSVELLEEFDPRLANYQGDALVSVHSNDCQDYGFAGTGYNAASASARGTTPGLDERLLDCLITQYGKTTGMPRHTGITHDMTEYHTFDEVSPDTPTAIIELGFLRNDRAMLTQQPDLLAEGIANGVRCFLQPDAFARPNTGIEAGQ